MSGPTTALLIADPIEVLLSAAAIRAAAAIRDGYRLSAELAAQHRSENSQRHAQQNNAAQLREQSLQDQRRNAETEYAQLLALSERLGVQDKIQAGRPLADPGETDAAVLVRALCDYNTAIKSILLTNAATHSSQDVWNAALLALPEFSDALANQPAQSPNGDVARLLTRIAHLGNPPEPIATLIKQLEQTVPVERRQLLMHELRRQIQLCLEDAQQQQIKEASALILRQTLQDLGYQVQEFSDTLFVEGGIVHFRRHAWGDYMVRMRINEKTNTANFNVLRAVHDDSNAVSVLDHLAEDRWCAEFPALLKAMEARGLGLTVTRRLEAGAVPVQLVNSAQLPQFQDEAQRRTDQPLQARELP